MNAATMRLRVRRTLGWQEYAVEVQSDGCVMDALEAAGSQDASLLYRHACHHASCGSCGMRINGREALPCITPLEVSQAGNGVLRLEPLRNFPVIGDLLVDLGLFWRRLDAVDLPYRRHAEPLMVGQGEAAGFERLLSPEAAEMPQISSGFNRLENCIECGLCVSACPVAGRDAQYAGPAVLAAAGRIVSEPYPGELARVTKLVNTEHGLWRCHAAFECTEVCPSNVDPAGEIMRLRSLLLRSAAHRDSKGRS